MSAVTSTNAGVTKAEVQTWNDKDVIVGAKFALLTCGDVEAAYILGEIIHRFERLSENYRANSDE